MFVFSDRENARTAKKTKFSWLSTSKQNISPTQNKENNMKYLFSTALPLLNDQLAADAGFKFLAFDTFL